MERIPKTHGFTTRAGLGGFGFWNRRFVRLFLVLAVLAVAVLVALGAVPLDLPALLGADEIASAEVGEDFFSDLTQDVKF